MRDIVDSSGLLMRRHVQDGVRSCALYSPCGRYRYGLRRVWRRGPELLFVMLNPSTATELRNDPTIERCQRRARALGFAGMRIANLFAWRATDPADLRRADAPVGDWNDTVVMRWHGICAMTLAAWGVHGAIGGRGRDMARALGGPLHHLGLTKGSHPRHPLYVSYNTQPDLWPMDDRYADQDTIRTARP